MVNGPWESKGNCDFRNYPTYDCSFRGFEEVQGRGGRARDPPVLPTPILENGVGQERTFPPTLIGSHSLRDSSGRLPKRRRRERNLWFLLSTIFGCTTSLSVTCE